MADFSILNPLAGGTMIGFAAILMFLVNGRITGISGIIGSVVQPEAGQVAWRVIFILGLLIGGSVYPLLWGRDLPVVAAGPLYLYIIAGLLVGFGTRTGSGCTSGHGICGLARFSTRSLVATITFMAAAIVTRMLVSILAG